LSDRWWRRGTLFGLINSRSALLAFFWAGGNPVAVLNEWPARSIPRRSQSTLQPSPTTFFSTFERLADEVHHPALTLDLFIAEPLDDSNDGVEDESDDETISTPSIPQRYWPRATGSAELIACPARPNG
jgi:hypothetical protein